MWCKHSNIYDGGQYVWQQIIFSKHYYLQHYETQCGQISRFTKEQHISHVLNIHCKVLILYFSFHFSFFHPYNITVGGDGIVDNVWTSWDRRIRCTCVCVYVCTYMRMCMCLCARVSMCVCLTSFSSSQQAAHVIHMRHTRTYDTHTHIHGEDHMRHTHKQWHIHTSYTYTDTSRSTKNITAVTTGKCSLIVTLNSEANASEYKVNIKYWRAFFKRIKTSFKK